MAVERLIGRSKIYQHVQIRMDNANTVKNTAISPNFLVWKFCGKAQFFFLFFILRRYKFLIYKFTNSTMNLIHTLIKINGC